MNSILPISSHTVRNEGGTSLCWKLKSLADKVVNICLAIFRAFFDLLTFPLRFVGSKTWSFPGVALRFPYLVFKRALGIACENSLKTELFGSGYHFQFEKKPLKEELKGYLPYIAAASFIHATNSFWIKSLGYHVIAPREFEIDEKGVEARNLCFFDPVSGLKVGVIEKGDHVIAIFGAIGSSESELENPSERKKIDRWGYQNVTWNLLGGIPSIYLQASDFFKKIRQNPRLNGKRVELAGQCYGGSVAQFLSLQHKVKALCVNSMAIGPGLQKIVGKKSLMAADKWVSHLSVERDFVSDSRGLWPVDQLMSGLGIRTAGNFGRRYVIPSGYSNAADLHNNVIGSALKYIGYDSNEKLSEIPEITNIYGHIS
ncbi:MAG: hypothetical protein KR126chlam1_00602 [Chlamydiae bacterium]|nr:hypothetical protein [Chlamydiota bacterium]